MESAVIFQEGDSVTWDTQLPKKRRRESIKRHGKGPFKVRGVQETPRDLRSAMLHRQMMRLDSRAPEVLVSGALLIRLDA